MLAMHTCEAALQTWLWSQAEAAQELPAGGGSAQLPHTAVLLPLQ
jgi:hypothetical protein